MLTALIPLALLAPPPQTFSAPAGTAPARVVPGGTTILPNGRFVTPLGKRLYTGEDLWNVVLQPGGKQAVSFCEGGLRVQNLSGTGAVNFSDIGLDGATLAFAFALALLTGIIFGLVPALQSTHHSLTGALKEEAGSGDGSPHIHYAR